MVDQLLVLSTQTLLMIDQNAMTIKYKVPVTELGPISCSPFADSIVVFHLVKVWCYNSHNQAENDKLLIFDYSNCSGFQGNK